MPDPVFVDSSGNNSLSSNNFDSPLAQGLTHYLPFLGNSATGFGQWGNRNIYRASSPVDKLSNSVDPLRHWFKGVRRTEDWIQHKPMDSAAIAATVYYGGGALLGSGSGGAGGGIGSGAAGDAGGAGGDAMGASGGFTGGNGALGANALGGDFGATADAGGGGAAGGGSMGDLGGGMVGYTDGLGSSAYQGSSAMAMQPEQFGGYTMYEGDTPTAAGASSSGGSTATPNYMQLGQNLTQMGQKMMQQQPQQQGTHAQQSPGVASGGSTLPIAQYSTPVLPNFAQNGGGAVPVGGYGGMYGGYGGYGGGYGRSMGPNNVPAGAPAGMPWNGNYNIGA